MDIRWLAPINHEAIAGHAAQCGGVLIVDEGRRSGGVSEAIAMGLIEHLDAADRREIRRVVGDDTYIPLGPAANLVLPSDEDVFNAALEMASGSKPARGKKMAKAK